MGRIKLDSINEFARRGYRVRVSCACGHKVDWNALDLMGRLHARRLPLDVDRLERRMRCSACGRKSARIGPVMADHAPIE